MTERTVVIGAGPAGLTAAWELARLGLPAVLLEKDDVVGGLSRTVSYNGYRFDIGGHRFFTKVPAIRAVWHELLGDDLLQRPRISRIFYKGRFFDYPLRPVDALTKIGPVEATRIVASYIRSRLSPRADERSFEDWVVNRFGRRLFEIFFKSYTEKVWGLPCSEISADWAAQRIKNLDLGTAISNALLGHDTNGGQIVSTLIERFDYPRLGPGMMWERCRDRVAEAGIDTLTGAEVTRVCHRDGRVTTLTIAREEAEETIDGSSFISSMPVPHLVRALDPPAPAAVIQAASTLRYRDFLTVVLVVEQAHMFPDNWIYIHDPGVQVGRVQNFKNWSPEMVPDPQRTTLGLEYFVQESDELWSRSDGELRDIGVRELARLGLIEPSKVVDHTVVRVQRAYPVYDGGFREALDVIRSYLSRFGNLQLIGRNGQHRYNNQDHSMLTGILAARNVAGEHHDVWSVNLEHAYHEAGPAGPEVLVERLQPEPLAKPRVEDLQPSPLARYDPISPRDVSVIVPVGGATPAWTRCWRALERLDPAPREIIAVFDGPGIDLGDLATDIGARVVVLDRSGGPAGARNRGSEVASGEILLFIDADVEAPPGLVARIVDLFNGRTGLTAVIGSYDDEPGDAGLLSQYRNLLHHFVHQQGRTEASTFWGACGAVRRSVFLELGGFDESFTTMEDVELGARLRRAGHSIYLDKGLQVKHLKRWRPVDMLATDLFGRAVPWTGLILRDRHMINDLNVNTRNRVSVLAAWTLLLSVAAACLWPPLLVAGAVSGLVLATLNAALVRFFIRKRGALFAVVSLFWYWIYLLLCGIGFGLGTARHLMGPRR